MGRIALRNAWRQSAATSARKPHALNVVKVRTAPSRRSLVVVKLDIIVNCADVRNSDDVTGKSGCNGVPQYVSRLF